MTFLLPHDSSYYAIRHFGGGPNDLLLDVGANDGISALSFRKLNPDIRILSLEPNALHHRALADLKSQIGNFDFMPLGAGDAAAEIRLYSPYYKHIALHTFTSGSAEQVRTAVAKSFGQNVADKIRIDECVASVVRIDDLNLSPRIVKIDVEGFDYKVLLGARETVKRSRPFMIVEVCHADIEPIRQYFAELDYVMLNFDQAQDRFAPLDMKAIEYASGARNVFAVPQELSARLPLVAPPGSPARP
jgi:FkbM family methyltransferase